MGLERVQGWPAGHRGDEVKYPSTVVTTPPLFWGGYYSPKLALPLDVLRLIDTNLNSYLQIRSYRRNIVESNAKDCN